MSAGNYPTFIRGQYMCQQDDMHTAGHGKQDGRSLSWRIRRRRLRVVAVTRQTAIAQAPRGTLVRRRPGSFFFGSPPMWLEKRIIDSGDQALRGLFSEGMCSCLATRPDDPQKGGSGKCQFVDGFGVCFLTKMAISGLPSIQHSTGRAFRALFIENFTGSLRPGNSIDKVGKKA